MKTLGSYFELVWVLAAVFSYYGARFNNAREIHLETFAPFLICLLTLAGMHFLFKENDQRLTQLTPYLRFFLSGFVSTLVIYWIWGEYGAPYLKDAALGLFAFYMFFGFISLAALFGVTIYEFVQGKPSVSWSEVALYLKIIMGGAFVVGVLIIGFKILIGFADKSKVGLDNERIIASWNEKSTPHSGVTLETADLPGVIKISVRSGLVLSVLGGNHTPVQKILQDPVQLAAIEKSLDEVLQNKKLLQTMGIPFENWKSHFLYTDFDSNNFSISTEVNVSEMTNKEWDLSSELLKKTDNGNNDVLLILVLRALLQSHQTPNDPNALEKAGLEIAYSYLKDEDPAFLAEIKAAVEAGKTNFFSEDRIQVLSENFKANEYKQIKILALRMIRFSMESVIPAKS